MLKCVDVDISNVNVLFAAMDLKLPLLNPYLDKTASFNNGVNFAVAASTALDDTFFAARNIPMKWAKTNAPLSVQLNWFKTYLNSSVCQSNSGCFLFIGFDIVIKHLAILYVLLLY